MNTLLIVLDDVGIEQIEVFGLNSSAANYPPQPNITALARRGVSFKRAYANPVCSPSRMTYRVGRYGFHTSVMTLVETTGGAPPSDEIFLPQVFQEAGDLIDTAIVGKWHLSTFMNEEEFHPCIAGYDWFAGTLRNFERGDNAYFSWERWDVNRKPPRHFKAKRTQMRTYTTTQQVDDAISWINSRESEWHLELAFNAPHFPFHRPPTDLYDTAKYSLPNQDPTTLEDKKPYYKAAINAIDTELGRLFASVDQTVWARTTVILIADNGSPVQVAETSIPGFTTGHAKGSVYEQGTRVPMIVAGPTVNLPGRINTTALIHTVDIFQTILDLHGVVSQSTPPGPLDSVSFHPNIISSTAGTQRTNYYVEVGDFNLRNLNASVAGKRAIGDGTYKLHRYSTGVTFPDALDEFYNVVTDPWEVTNLTPGGSTAGLTAPQLSAYNALRTAFTTLVAT